VPLWARENREPGNELDPTIPSLSWVRCQAAVKETTPWRSDGVVPTLQGSREEGLEA
jgi:hypothetical protein